MNEKIIVAKDLTKYYGKSRGIEKLCLEVKQGEIYGFIGPNGAGKSTTIRTLLGFLKPDSGRALLLGRDISKGIVDIKQHIGYIPADVNYYNDMRVKDLLRYSARFYKTDCTAQTEKLVDRLSISMDKKFRELSTGNKKKVAVAQALMHQPKLIILDEPTSGLDPLMQNVMFDLLAEENKKGATIFFSSHILSEVQRVCSRVGIMKDGVIIREADPKAVAGGNVMRYEAAFEGRPALTLNGISNVVEKDGTVSFIYNGSTDALIKYLAGFTVKSLRASEPDLEEIFMHYYQ